MLKSIAKQVWVFDLEWIPDIESGRRVYDLPTSFSDDAVLHEMWRQGGATLDDPQPFLKTILCRIVSVAAIIRKVAADGTVELKLLSLPEPSEFPNGGDEAAIIRRFLEGVGRHKPQIVGFNSRQSDLLILLQRALVHSLSLPDFCARPDKPWEGVDYLGRYSDFHIDLRDGLSGFGKSSSTLHELAATARIPGKLDTAGDQVLALWQDKKIDKIVAYNECDAVTTYLLWLRTALLTGKISAEQHYDEEQQLKTLLENKITKGAPHLQLFLNKWHALQKRHSPL